MPIDAHRNFAISTVSVAPSPASSGLSLTVADGTVFPAVPFNATVWAANTQPTVANAEIIRVTANAAGALTIVRTQESSSARTILVGDQIAATITTKTLTDIEAGPRAYTALSYYQTNQEPSGDLTSTPVQNRVEYHPFPVGQALTIDRITFGVSTAGAAGSVVRLGIYNDNDGIPGTLLLDAGTVAGTPLGYKEITVSQALAANTLYWIATVWQVAVVGVQRASGIGAGTPWVGHPALGTDPRVCGYFQASVTGALPASAAIVTTNTITQTAAVKVRAV